MDERVAQDILRVYSGKKLSVADARRVVVAWASQWPRDRWGNFKPSDDRRIKLTTRQVRREAKRQGGGWQALRSTPLVEAALNLVKKAGETVGDQRVVSKVEGRRATRSKTATKRAEKAKEEALHKEVMDMVAKVASSEMPVDFAELHDKGVASPEFQTRYNELVHRIQALRRLGKPPRDQDMFSTFRPPLAPVLMDVSAEWVEEMRGVPYTVTVRNGGRDVAVIEIGTSSAEMSLGTRVDPITRGVSSALDYDRKGDAYISGRIHRAADGPYGALYFIISREKQKGAGSRVLDLWCNLMDGYGAKAWVAEAVGEEGMAFLDAKVRSGRVEKVGGKGANIVMRCLGGSEGKQPRLRGVPLQPNEDEDLDDVREKRRLGQYDWATDKAYQQWAEEARRDHRPAPQLPPAGEPNPLHWLWSRYGRGGSMRSYYARGYATSAYAWAVPSPEAIEKIAAWSPILEVGAGRGYWAKLLAEAGADVIATDPWAPEDTFYPVEKLLDTEAVRKHGSGRTLLMVWPPYDMSVAFDALRAFEEVGGRRLVYVGEGSGGCTADDAFHEAVGLGSAGWRNKEGPPEDNRGWEQTDGDWDLPQWDGIHDSVYYLQRTALADNPGDIIGFPSRPERVTVGGRSYALSDVGVPVLTEAPGEEVSADDGPRIIDTGGNPFRYIWIYEPRSNQLEMYRFSDGDWKVGGNRADFPQTFDRLRASGQLNQVSPAELREFEAEMRKRNAETIERLQEAWEGDRSDEQRAVDALVRRYFDERVLPAIERGLRQIDQGVMPFDFRYNERIPKDRQEQAKAHVVGSELGRAGFHQPYGTELERFVLRELGKQSLDDLEDAQALQWATVDVNYSIYEELVPNSSSSSELVRIITEAWEPYLGARIAEERTRNAVMVLQSYPMNEQTPDMIRDVLMHAIVQAKLPLYGGVSISDSALVDAIEDAVQAIVDSRE